MTEAIEKTQPAGPLAVPDFLKGVTGGEGLEGATREDMVLPRMAVCQSLSPQRKRSNPAFIEGLEEGQLFNTVTREIYGTKASIIPLVFSKSRIYFRDVKQGGGILCQSFNGIDGGTIAPTCAECPNSQFAVDGTPPKCTNFINIVAAIMPARELAVLSFKSTELKSAKQFVTLMKSRNKPAYAQTYTIDVVEQTNQKGTFFGRVLKWAGFVQDEKDFRFAQNEYNSLKGKAIQTDEAHEPGADEALDEEPAF